MRGIILPATIAVLLTAILLVSSCASYELKPDTEEQLAAEEQQIGQELEDVEDMQELDQEAEEIEIEYEEPAEEGSSNSTISCSSTTSCSFGSSFATFAGSGLSDSVSKSFCTYALRSSRKEARRFFSALNSSS